MKTKMKNVIKEMKVFQKWVGNVCVCMKLW